MEIFHTIFLLLFNQLCNNKENYEKSDDEKSRLNDSLQRASVAEKR